MITLCDIFTAELRLCKRYQATSLEAISEDDIQSTLVISKSKGPCEILRDIRTSTYQMCRL